MKYTVLVIAAVAVLGLFTPAYAQVVGGGKKGVFAKHQGFAKDPQEAFKQAKERQCPVVLCICAIRAGIYAEPGEFCKTSIKKMSQYFVILVAHPAYPSVFKWARQFANAGGSWPTANNMYVFFDCSGNELTERRQRYGCSHEHLAKTMASIIKEKGRGIPLKDYAKVKSDFAAANHLYEVGAWYEAYKAYGKLAKKDYEPEPEMIRISKEREQDIIEKTASHLKEIQGRIEGGARAEALVELHILRARCKGLKIVAEITKAISDLEKDDSITRAQKKKAAYEAKACGKYLRAEEYAAEGNEKSAKGLFEQVTKVYRESSFAEKAEERLAAF
jgi:hypothetical protein